MTDENSPADRPPIGGRSLPDRTPLAGLSRASRSAATNRPASRWSVRTAHGRRCRDLFKGYMTQLGNPSDPPTMALAIAAAEGVVLAEIARQECLAGMTGMNAELMIRCENSANRALRRIGLAKASPKATGPNLQEFLAARKTT